VHGPEFSGPQALQRFSLGPAQQNEGCCHEVRMHFTVETIG